MERDDGAGSGRDEADPSAADSFVRILELRTSIAEVLSRINEIRQQEIPQIKADSGRIAKDTCNVLPGSEKSGSQRLMNG